MNSENSQARSAKMALQTPWTPALINNKHPMVPLSTLQAGFRLILHGLATETQHAILVKCKREQAARSISGCFHQSAQRCNS